MGNTSIEWSGKTWNPIKAITKQDATVPTKANPFRVIPAGTIGYHCEHVSAGCKNCYAEAMNGRTLPAWGTGLDYTVPNREKVEIFLDEDVLREPLGWKKPTKIFPCSMTDWAADFVTDEMMDRMLGVAALTPRHTYQFLTKRADRLARYILERHRPLNSSCVEVFDIGTGNVRSASWINPLPNVQLGFSAEDQPNFDARWAHMRRLADVGWFVWCSYEPALGPIDFTRINYTRELRETLVEFAKWSAARDGRNVEEAAAVAAASVSDEGLPDGEKPNINSLTGEWFDGWDSGDDGGKLSWLVVGGESGPGARKCDRRWIYNCVRQCQQVGVPVFVKQLGAKSHIDDNGSFLPLKNKKGGDITEFPPDLRVREFPEVAHP